MGKRSLPAIRTDHNLAHSLYDHKSTCHIPFGHYISVYGVSALGKGLVSQFGDEYREYQKKANRIIPQF
jgi:hypothetical protein